MASATTITTVSGEEDLESVIETMEDLLSRTEQEMESVEAEIEMEDEQNKTTEQQKLVVVAYEQEIARLQDLVKNKELENVGLENKLVECEQQAKVKIEQLHLGFTQKLEQTLKKFQDMQKDKTSTMVMKYAEAEKRCIDLNRNVELSASKLNDALREKQQMGDRLAKVRVELDKLSTAHEIKVKEVMQLKQELRDSIVLSEAKDKASQLKLKQEIDAGLSSKRQLLQLSAEINALKAKLEEGQVNNGENEESKTGLESNQEVVDLVKAVKPVNYNNSVEQRELVALKSQLKDMFEERQTLRERCGCMESERRSQEQTLVKFKETIQSQKQMNKELLNEILQLREMQETFHKEQKEKTELTHKFTLLTVELSDLRVELNKSQEKQTELLEFTAKLTDKNSQLQSENISLQERLEQVEKELNETTHISKQLAETGSIEKEQTSAQLIDMDRKVKDLTTDLDANVNKVKELKQQLEDERSENATLKKKHASNVKDLSRQLQSLQKKITNSTPVAMTTNTTIAELPSSSTPQQQQQHLNSRTSSFSSLTDAMNEQFQVPSSRSFSSNNNNYNQHFDTRSESNYSNTMSRSYANEVHCGTGQNEENVYVTDVDKQKIIEKVCQLQKTLAKRTEKVDFLQDHVEQLTRDVQRKTRIIQAYAMSIEEVNCFTSEARDAAKLEMSRKTGSIMSALYKSSSTNTHSANNANNNNNNTNNNMTMELCLEINGKLQALLEDTLIKNLTLKESLETLGQEIARLSQENRRIRSKD